MTLIAFHLISVPLTTIWSNNIQDHYLDLFHCTVFVMKIDSIMSRYEGEALIDTYILCYR